MLERLASGWWILALRGVIGILIGIFAFARPMATLAALITLFGVYMLIDGIAAVIAAFGRAGDARWWVLLDGLAGIVIGLLALFRPGLTAVTLLYFIAAWAVIAGVFRIIDAVRLRNVIENEWMLVISGVLSVVLGIVLFLMPGLGMVTGVYMIGAYAFLSGLMMLAVAFRLRGLRAAGGPGRPAAVAH